MRDDANPHHPNLAPGQDATSPPPRSEPGADRAVEGVGDAPGRAADRLVSSGGVYDLVTDEWDGIPGEIADATTPRATAIGRYASEAGVDFREVRCTTRHIRLWTFQDAWEHAGGDRWLDQQADPDEGGPVDYPDVPPEGWEPDETDPAWEFCKPDTPGAIGVWHCEQPERERQP